MTDTAPPVSDFKFFFGIRGDAGNNRTYNGQSYAPRPWFLRHVTSINMSISGQTTLVNTAGRPASKAQIFDTGGSIRNISISGFRSDFEEQVPNWDWVFNEYNYYTNDSGERVYSIGMDFYDSRVQTTLKGYILSIQGNANDPRYKVENDINVSVNGFSFNFIPNQPQTIEYTITLVERRKYGSKIY